MQVVFDYHRLNRKIMAGYVKELHKALQLASDSDLLKYRREIERSFAAYIGTRDAYLVQSGTAAIQLALQMVGVGKGHEVILPVVNYPSAVASICYLGAKPVFVDVLDDATMNLDALEDIITPRTKAILPVHLFGHPVNMKRLMEIAHKHEIAVVEDACQAHGGVLNGKKLGSYGTINAFSFTYHKVLGCIGGGGALVFDNHAVRNRLNEALVVEKDSPLLLESGRAPGKMSLADMVMLKVKLKIASQIIADKQHNQELYENALARIPQVTIFSQKKDSEVVRQAFFILAERRDELKEYLASQGVTTKLPYLVSDRMSICQAYVGETYPGSQKHHDSGLQLPLPPLMREEEIRYIAGSIRDFYEKS